MTRTAEMPPVLAADNVHFSYRDTPALDGLTLSCRPGEHVVLLGANGSGKSTLLKLLDALVFPARGSVSAFGQPLTEEAMEDEFDGDRLQETGRPRLSESRRPAFLPNCLRRACLRTAATPLAAQPDP